MTIKRVLLPLCLAACLLLLCSCDTSITNPLVEAAATLEPGAETLLPAAAGDDVLQTSNRSTLYFRYLNEPYLACETRVVTQLANQSYEEALVQTLIGGPSARSTDLQRLFPPGVRVLSTSHSGRTEYVHLSAEIMNDYDRPNEWKNVDDALWAQEVALRCQLCIQSIVATITENCDVDQVQIMVDDGTLSTSLRLQKRYFREDPTDTSTVGPLTRDATMLLEPDTTLGELLSCWCAQDWTRMYNYVAARDPQTGVERLPLADFIAQMSGMHAMLDWSFYGGSVSANGQTMTYAIDLVMLGDGGLEYEATGRILRLHRDNDVWKITMAQLTGWLEE